MYRISVRITPKCTLIPFSAGKIDCMYVISDGSANAEALGPLKWPLSTTGGKWMFGSHWSLLGPRASALGEGRLSTQIDCMYVISDGSANAEVLGPLKWPLSTTGGKWMFGSHWSLLGPRASALGEGRLSTLSASIFPAEHGNKLNSAVIAYSDAWAKKPVLLQL